MLLGSDTAEARDPAASLQAALISRLHGAIAPADWPVAVLALMMFLVPALGVPSELMLQDTLKSALVAFGVLIAALVFFWQQRNRSVPLLWHGLVWLPLALMAYALGSMAWSHTYLAGVEAIRWFILSLLLWLGLNTLTRENLPLLIWGIHGGALVASIWAGLQFWFDFGLFPQGPVPASTFINRNFFAEYAVSALPFSVYLLANFRASRWLALVALSVALDVVALMMTGTRSALLALMVLAPVLALILIRYQQQFAFVTWSRAQQALVGLVLVIGVMGMGSVPSGNAKVIQEGMGTTALQRSFLRAASMAEGKEYTERSFSIRATMWKATARMMIANPWTGVGAGAWEVQIPLYQRVGEGMETDFYAHNEFLQLLSEYGVVVGGLFIAVLLAYLLIAAGKTWRLQGTDLAEAPLRALTLASPLALQIVSNAGFAWRLASTGALLALGLAILAGSDARLGVREAFFAGALRWRPVFSRTALAGVLCCSLLTSYITQQATEAEHKIFGAIKLAFYVTDTKALDEGTATKLKAAFLQSLREGIGINPHYRRYAPQVAEQLVAIGDWTNATWIWESTAASRPNVANIWSNLVSAYIRTHQYDKARQALNRLQQLMPDASHTKVLALILLSRTGQATQAAQILTDYFDHGGVDYELVQAGYVLGVEMNNWPLAIRSLEIRIHTWPDQAASSYFSLGQVYSNPNVDDEAKALAAFRAGLQAVPTQEQDSFRKQVPEKYRASL
jgi:O-antigen ligase